MPQQKRPPTKATLKVDPSFEVHKTLYPYINLKGDGLTPYFNAFKRSIAPFNPFALQQIPTSDRAAIGLKYGSNWYFQDTYPNTIYFDRSFPSHYDPFKDIRRKHIPGVIYATHPGDQIGFIGYQFPRFCSRTISFYKRCLIANNDNQSKCSEEQENIMSICPNWALDSMREKKRHQSKLQALSNQRYREVMEVPQYNKGRTVANAAKKSWINGTASYLRPDTMWIDQRYADITQDQIDKAKERVKARELAKGISHSDSIHFQLYDRSQEKAQSIPLYP